MQITVDDHQIVNCVCYYSGNNVEFIHLGGDENLYGFNQDGNAIIDESILFNEEYDHSEINDELEDNMYDNEDFDDELEDNMYDNEDLL